VWLVWPFELKICKTRTVGAARGQWRSGRSSTSKTTAITTATSTLCVWWREQQSAIAKPETALNVPPTQRRARRAPNKGASPPFHLHHGREDRSPVSRPSRPLAHDDRTDTSKPAIPALPQARPRLDHPPIPLARPSSLHPLPFRSQQAGHAAEATKSMVYHPRWTRKWGWDEKTVLMPE